MKRFFILILLIVGFTMTQAKAETTAFDFIFEDIDGEELPLSKFTGKTVMVVNTASYCGFTKQYDALQAVWAKYRDRGLIVLGVPSNDFGQQEPGTEKEIKEFCEVNFNINFPMTQKEVVSGKNAHPFYQWARKELGFVAAPKWNFHKYLIDGNGKLVDWFATTTKPDAPKVIAAIEKSLGR